MKKSALQEARAAYQPKLPKALQGPVVAVEGAATQSVGNQDEIKAMFPNTYGMPVITFEAGEQTALEPINVGIILSGGQAPGGHNVISGLYDGVKSLNKDSKLYGFLMGPGGLVDGKEVQMIVKVGDCVITSKYSGTEVKADNTDLIIVRQGDILAIVE